MNKILFLILLILVFCSCEEEIKNNIELIDPARKLLAIKYTNTTTNTFLFLFHAAFYNRTATNILEPFKDKEVFLREFTTSLSKSDIEISGTSDISDTLDNRTNLNGFTKNLNFIFYDNQTNFLFKITNHLSLFVEYHYHIGEGYPENKTGDIVFTHIMPIDDSVFTNSYWGTTNE